MRVGITTRVTRAGLHEIVVLFWPYITISRGIFPHSLLGPGALCVSDFRFFLVAQKLAFDVNLLEMYCISVENLTLKGNAWRGGLYWAKEFRKPGSVFCTRDPLRG